MPKKSFKAGFDALLGENNSDSKKYSNNKNSLSDKSSEIRYTIIIDKSSLDKVKFIAFWKRKHIKEVFSDALENYINDYEIKNGSITLFRNDQD